MTVAGVVLAPPSTMTDSVSVHLMPRQFVRGETHVYRLIAGEHLLVALHGDSPEPLFALTPTAALLWERLVDWTERSELVAALLEGFEVDEPRARADVDEFLAQLEAVGAVHSRGAEE